MARQFSIAAVLAAIFFSPAADARVGERGARRVVRSGHASVCEKAYAARARVVAVHGARAPGRNVCRMGVVVRHHIRRATYREKRAYLFALRDLVAPVAFMAKRASPPGRPPAGTLSPVLAPSGLAACIVQHESGGVPTASNGQYSGIAQWSAEAWSRMGGGRYASSPTGASYQQQLAVLSYGLSRWGCRDWCPYDGC